MDRVDAPPRLNSYLLLLLLWLLFLAGCHSKSVKAPDEPLSLAASSPVNLNETKWQSDYTWARLHQQDDPETACKIFDHLAHTKEFPVRDLAELRSFEVCGQKKTATPQSPTSSPNNIDREQLPRWLQSMALDVLLKLAEMQSDPATETTLAVEKSKQRLSQNDKVNWMNVALKCAEDSHQEALLPELKARLYEIAPRLNPQPSERQFLAVAGDFRLARQFDKALEYYNKALHSRLLDREGKISALKGIRLIYKNSRQNEAHLTATAKLIRFLQTELKAHPKDRRLLKTYHDACVYQGRALWTLGRTSDAKRVFDRLIKRVKGKMALAELYWLKGRMAEEVRDFRNVSTNLHLALKEKFTDLDLRDKVMWFSAWNERQQNHLPQAIEIMKQLDEQTQNEFVRQRDLFWLGKTLAQNQQAEDSRAIFERLIQLDPIGYYGLMARRELGRPITLRNPKPEAPRPPTTALDSQVADWLVRLNENEALTAYLDQVSQIFEKSLRQTNEDWVVIFQYYASAGSFNKLLEKVGNLSPELRQSLFESHPELLFPQPWKQEISQAAAQFGTEPEWVYSIIRQESGFDPHARSVADAFGLMQLLPEVAENLKTKYNINYSAAEDLYDPKTNILMGAAHFKELLSHQKGRFILAVASYNASDSVIRSWMKNRFQGDTLEFIEEIPYEETRSYVRLVLRNLVFYKLLNSKSDAIMIPDWPLDLG